MYHVILLCQFFFRNDNGMHIISIASVSITSIFNDITFNFSTKWRTWQHDIQNAPTQTNIIRHVFKVQWNDF